MLELIFRGYVFVCEEDDWVGLRVIFIEFMIWVSKAKFIWKDRQDHLHF